MEIEMVNCFDTIMQIIKDKKATKKSVAKAYAFALRSSENPDWKIINNAIIKRWSIRALEDITNMAWSGSCFK